MCVAWECCLHVALLSSSAAAEPPSGTECRAEGCHCVDCGALSEFISSLPSHSTNMFCRCWGMSAHTLMHARTHTQTCTHIQYIGPPPSSLTIEKPAKICLVLCVHTCTLVVTVRPTWKKLINNFKRKISDEISWMWMWCFSLRFSSKSAVEKDACIMGPNKLNTQHKVGRLLFYILPSMSKL